MDMKMATEASGSMGNSNSGSVMDNQSKCRSPSMIWNWDTINSCLISRSWHIKSTAQFGASCFAILLLAMSLPLLRKLAKAYDARILRNHQKHLEDSKNVKSSGSEDSTQSASSLNNRMSKFMHHGDPTRFRPSPLQQITRAFLHVSQFIIGYFVML
jgi:solute carrier family 31 (copper transporter), member 1